MRIAIGADHAGVRTLHRDTPVEIATALDVSPITVRTRLLRVRAILRAATLNLVSAASAARIVSREWLDSVHGQQGHPSPLQQGQSQ